MQIGPGPAHTPVGVTSLGGPEWEALGDAPACACTGASDYAGASRLLPLLACDGERGVARGYAGAATCVCAARGARRPPQPRPPGTPRYQRGLLEGGWDCPRAPSPSSTDPPLPSSSGDAAQVGPGAAEPRRHSPPSENQRERARSGPLPLGALFTAAAVAFVLYKCLQVRDGQGWGCPALNLDEGAMVPRTRHVFPSFCKMKTGLP